MIPQTGFYMFWIILLNYEIKYSVSDKFIFYVIINTFTNKQNTCILNVWQ